MATKKKPSALKIRVIAAVITLVFLTGGFLIIKALISDDNKKKRRHVQMVTLLKPPPPPVIKEKPPEPEKKEEKIKEPEPEEAPEEADADDRPTDDNLGVDADGGAGSDDFGLVGKKGGRSIIGGDLSRNALLRRYAWYYQIVEKEIRKKVNGLMDQEGGIPDGNLKAVVELYLDDRGKVLNFSIPGSSGVKKMDDAVTRALGKMQISEPPPADMPKGIRIIVSAKG